MIQIIEAIICQDRKITPESLHFKTRYREITECRQIVMYFARKKTSLSLCQIGKYFDLDHATVMHSMKTINNMIDTYKEFRHKISIYKAAIDQYTDNSLNDTLITIAVLKIEIETLKRQLSEKETLLLNLQNTLK